MTPGHFNNVLRQLHLACCKAVAMAGLPLSPWQNAMLPYLIAKPASVALHQVQRDDAYLRKIEEWLRRHDGDMP